MLPVGRLFMGKSDRIIADCATLLGDYIRSDGNGLDGEERKAARIASGYASTGGFFYALVLPAPF
jgi:hypothetical protein